MTDALELDRLATPIGECLVLFDQHGRLRALDWSEFEGRMRRLLARQDPAAVVSGARRAPEEIRSALEAYFAGDLAAPERIRCKTGGTSFQKSVWQLLRSIPPATTTTYGCLAHELGVPGGARAVGLANGANPLGIVVPCHRVVGADRSLTGYGGGLQRKRWLLRHEGALESTREVRAGVEVGA